MPPNTSMVPELKFEIVLCIFEVAALLQRNLCRNCSATLLSRTSIKPPTLMVPRIFDIRVGAQTEPRQPIVSVLLIDQASGGLVNRGSVVVHGQRLGDCRSIDRDRIIRRQADSADR